MHRRYRRSRTIRMAFVDAMTWSCGRALPTGIAEVRLDPSDALYDFLATLLASTDGAGGGDATRPSPLRLVEQRGAAVEVSYGTLIGSGPRR